MSKRLTAKVKEVRREVMDRRHEPVPDVGRWLQSVTRGFFNYHAVPGNLRALWLFRFEIGKAWKRALERRSQKADVLWARMTKLITTWLPRPTTIHPYPNRRLRVTT